MLGKALLQIQQVANPCHCQQQQSFLFQDVSCSQIFNFMLVKIFAPNYKPSVVPISLPSEELAGGHLKLCLTCVHAKPA